MKNLLLNSYCTIRTLMLTLICLLTVTFSAQIYAEQQPKPVIDVFKTDQITLQTINKKFAANFQAIADIIRSPDSITSTKNTEDLLKLLNKTVSDINNLGSFAWVTISPIMYPDNNVTYFTIDIVDKADKTRLSHFLVKPTRSIPDPDHLIQTWQEYEKIGFDKFFKTKTAPVIKSCPAFHCLMGFDAPELSKYKNIFMTGVPKNKSQLVTVLKEDKDENKRAAAALLLAHIQDGNELINILAPSMRDPSGQVRNNTMRVLGATLAKNTKADFPVQDAITALDFPELTDRNKALYILSSLSDQPRYAKYIAQHAQSELLDELKMRQLNVHNLAYEILTKISGKKYGERNYAAWKRWLDKNSETSTPLVHAGQQPKPVIDIFKTQQTTVEIINKKFGANFQVLADIMQSPDSVASTKNSKEFNELLKKTINGISELGSFSDLTLSAVLYPHNNITYFTIDIVDKADSKRLSYFSSKPTGSIPDPDNLIQAWQEYEKMSNKKFYKEKSAPVVKNCPAFYCSYGYDEPAFAKYKNIFMTEVPKNKAELITVLKQDKDENKRATAAFLLAHIKDSNELINILVPSIRDTSGNVRNNVLSVLGSTLAKDTKADFPVQEAITALDFPQAGERNKALYLVSSLADQPRYAEYIAQHAQTQLLEELKMLQPDLHDPAYEILTKISGKKYGERNYAAWKRWLDKNSGTLS